MAGSIAALLDHETLGLRTAAALQAAGPRAGAALEDLLAAGGLHEWFLMLGSMADRRDVWYAPLTLLALWAGRKAAAPRKVVWVGRACWPTLQILGAVLGRDGTPASGGDLTRRCIFLDPQSDKERFWGLGQVLRCAGVGAVVADGSGMDATVSRRLQLAAEAGGVLALLARPPWEQHEPSWAMTRWVVRPLVSEMLRPQWSIELAGGRRPPGPEVPRRWVADWSYEVFRGTGACHLSAAVGCGIDRTPTRRRGAVA